MKTSERHDLQRNKLSEFFSDPGELVRKYGLTVLVLVLALGVAIWLIWRTIGADTRRLQRAWEPFQQAEAAYSEEQLKAVANDSGNQTVVRVWAKVRLGELLYNKSQQPQYSSDSGVKVELVKQAIEAYRDAAKTGQDYPQVVGQAAIGQGLCYENLGQWAQAGEQYDSIISGAEGRFAGTVWLDTAKSRKQLLEHLAKENVFFGSASSGSSSTGTGGAP